MLLHVPVRTPFPLFLKREIRTSSIVPKMCRREEQLTGHTITLLLSFYRGSYCRTSTLCSTIPTPTINTKLYSLLLHGQNCWWILKTLLESDSNHDKVTGSQRIRSVFQSSIDNKNQFLCEQRLQKSLSSIFFNSSVNSNRSNTGCKV